MNSAEYRSIPNKILHGIHVHAHVHTLTCVCLNPCSCTTPGMQRNSMFYKWNTSEFRKTLTFGIPRGILRDTYIAIFDGSKKFRWNSVLTKFRRHSNLLLNIVHWKLLFFRNSRLQVK
jgi:hypothetical protein